MSGQTGLGRFRFTRNGKPASLVPVVEPRSARTRDAAPDLFPELWAHVFTSLPHPAQLIIAARVCKTWRTLAQRQLLVLIAGAHLLFARAREAYIHTYQDMFEYGGRLFTYYQSIRQTVYGDTPLEPVLEIEINRHDYCDFGRPTAGPKAYHMEFVVEDHFACEACGRVIRRVDIPAGCIRGRFVFCGEPCVLRALNKWAEKCPIINR